MSYLFSHQVPICEGWRCRRRVPGWWRWWWFRCRSSCRGGGSLMVPRLWGWRRWSGRGWAIVCGPCSSTNYLYSILLSAFFPLHPDSSKPLRLLHSYTSAQGTSPLPLFFCHLKSSFSNFRSSWWGMEMLFFPRLFVEFQGKLSSQLFLGGCSSLTGCYISIPSQRILSVCYLSSFNWCILPSFNYLFYPSRNTPVMGGLQTVL